MDFSILFRNLFGPCKEDADVRTALFVALNGQVIGLGKPG